MRVYTKTGDKGLTSNYNGERVSKGSILIEVVGKIDELQASLDSSIVDIQEDELKNLIEKVQDKLWQMAGEISLGELNDKIKDPIMEDDITQMEHYIDNNRPEMNVFLRYRNSSSAKLNEARVRCRALERVLVTFNEQNTFREELLKYINRLSDFLYVLACVEAKKDMREHKK